MPPVEETPAAGDPAAPTPPQDVPAPAAEPPPPTVHANGEACGTVNDCVRTTWQQDLCRFERVKETGARCATATGEEGTCHLDTCLQGVREAAWGWSDVEFSRFVGQGPQGLLLQKTDYAYAGLVQLDGQGGARTLQDGDGRTVLLAHGRYLVGYTSYNYGGIKLYEVRRLDRDEPARSVDLTALVRERLAEVGLFSEWVVPRWVQGAPGQALMLVQVNPASLWVGSFDLERLELGWSRVLSGALPAETEPGLLEGVIADEDGQLYLSLDAGSPRLVALSAAGGERWVLPGEARPVAVFGGTLFLDDGTVRDTADGALRYRWSAAPNAQVRLSATHAAVAESCGKGCIQAQVLERESGRVLAQEQLPTPDSGYWSGLSGLLLAADGRVLVLQYVTHPELTDTPFYIPLGIRWLEVRPQGGWTLHGESLFSEGGVPEAVLLEDSVVLRHLWSAHNTYPDQVPSSYYGFTWPGWSPPAHGWLGPQGGVGRALAPQ
ncbi:hypothetical protein IR215_27230 [Simulacricoccus sp. 17bor-14]|nr:hypothetical protein [Simulacricoccus sp. 17bor-14]